MKIVLNESSVRRKICLWIVSLLLFTIASGVGAQQSKKLPRIGYLSALSPSSESTRAETIRLALRDLGYSEGRDISVEYRYSEGTPGRASEQAAELVRLNPDLIIVAGGDQWIRAVRNATQTIPIIMVGGGLDPVEAGHVESLARPGGNVTGLTILNTEVARKRLELLKETVPRVARVAVLSRQDLPSNVRELKEVQAAAHGLNVTVQSLPLTVGDSLDKPFRFLNKYGADGLYVSQGPLTTLYGKEVADLRSKQPVALSLQQ